MAAKPKPVDWAAIETEYRVGRRSLREIGKTAGLSHVSIKKRADAEGWLRDLKVRIREKAAEKIAKAAVKTKRITPATEAVVVEANATMQAAITLEHREDVKRARAVVRSLLEELETYGANRDQLEAIAEVAARQRLGEEPDRKALAKSIEAMMDSVDFPSRVGAAHKLADALVKCVTLERTVAGISDDERRDGDVAAALKALAAAVVPDQPVE